LAFQVSTRASYQLLCHCLATAIWENFKIYLGKFPVEDQFYLQLEGVKVFVCSQAAKLRGPEIDKVGASASITPKAAHLRGT
jgi:hypothetical protein